MPRENDCNHPNCAGEPCKMLTPAELEITAEHRAVAEQLITEDWIQVSAKYRMIRRWLTKPPTMEAMLRPEYVNTFWGKHAVDRLRWLFDDNAIRCAPKEEFEERVLTVPEFKAFKELKNKPWRDYVARNRTARTAPPKGADS